MSDEEAGSGVRPTLDELLERSQRLEAAALQQQQGNRLLRARIEAMSGRTGGDGAHGAGASVPSAPVTEPGSVPVTVTGRVSRRRLLAATGVGLAGGAVAVGALRGTPAGAAARQSGRSNGTADYAVLTTSSSATITVLPPTGMPSIDTANILTALSQAAAGTSVTLQCKPGLAYVINQELPIPPGVHLTATGAANEVTAAGIPKKPGQYMATLQQAPGTALRCVVGSAAYLAGLYGPANPGNYPTYNNLYNNGTPNTTGDSAIEIDHVAFDGQNGGSQPGNTLGHGIVLFSDGSRVHDCFIFNTAQAGIVVTDANYAGAAGTGPLLDNRIYDNQLLNTGSQAILVTNTPGSTGCHDGYLLNNNIEAPSKEVASTTSGPNLSPGTGLPYEAVRLENAAGWWVVNNHPYQVPGNGWYLANIWGLHFVDNSTDDFGAVPVNGATYVGYDFYFSTPTETTPPSLHPAFINGNQISGYEGLNTNNHNAGAGNQATNATNTILYFRITMQLASQLNPVPASFIEHSDNSAHQNSQPAASISGGTVIAGSSIVSFGTSVVGLLQTGMSITDSAGLIPAGTFIGAVSSNGTSVTMVDIKGLPVTATGSGGNDLISFPPPTSAGWTYVNEVGSSTLVVHRTNELISPTINDAPVTSGAGGVSIVDPADFAGGLRISGSPSAGQTIVATSAMAATWGAPPAGTPSGPAGGVLGGTYPNPTLAPSLSATLTSSGSYSIPTIATRLRITCVGGGGGGGGGGAAAAAIAQAGGSGGAAGTASVQFLAVTGGQLLTVTIGNGGGGGTGGAGAADSAGGNGGGGGDTTVSGTAISIRGSGGCGGKGAARGSTAVTPGAAYGAPAGTFTASTTGGSGGSSARPGGFPIADSPGGGGGGGAAGAGPGGGAGGAGSALGGGAGGATGGSSQSAGGPGGSAADSGGAGGGGGGGSNGGAGGAGGAGAPGFVVIEVVG